MEKYYQVSVPISRLALSPAYKWCLQNLELRFKKSFRQGECEYHWLSKKDYDEMQEHFYFDSEANAMLFSLIWAGRNE